MRSSQRVQRLLKRLAIIFAIAILLQILNQNCGVSPESKNNVAKTSVSTPKPRPQPSPSSSPQITPSPLPSPQTVQILKDPEFSRGFRAHYEFCSSYSLPPLGGRIYQGDCIEYGGVPVGYQIRTIPDPLGHPNDVGKYWEFQEGEKQGLICGDTNYHHNLPPGPYPPEIINGQTYYRFGPRLYSHRMSGQETVITNLTNSLTVTNSSSSGTVRKLTTNKAGAVTVDFKSANEVRNIATSHSACYSQETWPHFHLWQTLKTAEDIGKYQSLRFRLNIKITKQQMVRNLAGYDDDSIYGFTFMLRKKSNPWVSVWFGTILYGDPVISGRYDQMVFADQYGIAILNMATAKFGGPLVIGTTRSIDVDLKELIREHLPLLKAAYPQSEHSNNPDDYNIYAFGMGWEVVGEWDAQAQISNLSLTGIRKP